MNQQNQPTPINDDQELAKALAGISQEGANLELDPALANEIANQAPDDTPVVQFPDMPDPVDLAETTIDQTVSTPEAITPVAPNPNPVTPVAPATNENTIITTGQQFLGEEQLPVVENSPVGNLDSIRVEALSELRPLVDKLDLNPEERFDIYLLLIRNTDDTSLIAPAHVVAKTIADETKRAESLLEIIKEIDFLSKSE